VSDGYVNFLQYRHTETRVTTLSFKFLFLRIHRERTRVVQTKWKYVWRPYYDRSYGRSLDTLGYDCYVCAYNENLTKFPTKWPRISAYFEWAKAQQDLLEAAVRKRNAEIEEKKGKVKKLT
jgi:hypothetical protein